MTHEYSPIEEFEKAICHGFEGGRIEDIRGSDAMDALGTEVSGGIYQGLPATVDLTGAVQVHDRELYDSISAWNQAGGFEIQHRESEALHIGASPGGRCR